MEKSFLGSKCVLPSSSSPVPDTPTKVAYFWHVSVKTVGFDSRNKQTNKQICFFFFFLSLFQLSSKPGFFRQTSERRSFKLLELRKINRDISIPTPSRSSPPSTPSSPDDTPCLSGDPYNRRRRKIPKVRNTEGPLKGTGSDLQWCKLHEEVWRWSTHAAIWRWVKWGKFSDDISCQKCSWKKQPPTPTLFY